MVGVCLRQFSLQMNVGWDNCWLLAEGTGTSLGTVIS